MLAALAIHARADSWFLEAAELRVKESDRLGALTRCIRDLGGQAADEGVDLVIAGGGLEGGRTSAGGDHRIAMAMAVAALGARSTLEDRRYGCRRGQLPGVRGDAGAARCAAGGAMTAPAVIIAVDGAAGSGKSTLARGLARALGVAVRQHGVDVSGAGGRVDPRGGRLPMMPKRWSTSREGYGSPSGARTHPSSRSRVTSPKSSRPTRSSRAVSVVSRHPAVRALMRDVQRTLGARGAVMEGRDIATVVFPDAPREGVPSGLRARAERPPSARARIGERHHGARGAPRARRPGRPDQSPRAGAGCAS